MNINRRGIFALGGLGAIGVGSGAQGAEYRLDGGVTITIQRMDHEGGWGVAVPDWEAMRSRYHTVGMLPPIKLMPMAEFLAALNKLDEPEPST